MFAFFSEFGSTSRINSFSSRRDLRKGPHRPEILRVRAFPPLRLSPQTPSET
jgi:hypothetical protein